MDFYIDVNSISSSQIYPQNTASNFSNFYPQNITLPPNFEAAIVEVQYTRSFNNISFKTGAQVGIFNYFYYHRKEEDTWGLWVDIVLSSENYTGEQSLANAYNEQIWRIVPRLKNIKLFKFDHLKCAPIRPRL